MLKFYDQFLIESDSLFLDKANIKKTERLVNLFRRKIDDVRLELDKIKANKLRHKPGKRSQKEKDLENEITELEIKVKSLRDERDNMSSVI